MLPFAHEMPRRFRARPGATGGSTASVRRTASARSGDRRSRFRVFAFASTMRAPSEANAKVGASSSAPQLLVAGVEVEEGHAPRPP